MRHKVRGQPAGEITPRTDERAFPSAERTYQRAYPIRAISARSLLSSAAEATERNSVERFRRRRRGLQANAASGSQSSRDRSPIHEVFPAERHRCQYRALGPDSPLSVSVKPFSPAQPPEQLHQQISDNLGEGEVFARNIHRSHDSSRRYAIAHAFPAIRMHSDDAKPCRCLCWSKVFMQVEAIIAGESTSQRPPTSGREGF